MTRRDFLAMAFITAVANVLPAQAEAAEVPYEWESRPEIIRLTRSFDRKSLKAKKEFIENLGTIEIKAERADREELAREIRRAIKQLQDYYRRRLEVIR